jgi:hypothetical protein
MCTWWGVWGGDLLVYPFTRTLATNCPNLRPLLCPQDRRAWGGGKELAKNRTLQIITVVSCSLGNLLLYFKNILKAGSFLYTTNISNIFMICNMC